MPATQTRERTRPPLFVGVPWGDGRWVCLCDGSRPGQEAVTLQPAGREECPACGCVRPQYEDRSASGILRRGR